MVSEPAVKVARWFDDIVTRTAGGDDVSTLPYAEQVVYYVVAVRTEADMNGFCSVFEQLLTHEADVALFVRMLRHLEEENLAETFAAIQRLLREARYFEDVTRELHGLPADVRESFGILERQALSGDRLWELDEKLANLQGQR